MAETKDQSVCVVDVATATAAIYTNVGGEGFKRTEYASGLKTDPAFGKGTAPSVGAAGDYVAALRLVDGSNGRLLGPAQEDIHIKIQDWKGKQPVGTCEVHSTDGTIGKLPLVDKKTLTMAPATP